MRRFLVSAALLAAVVSLPAQQMVTETRDPKQTQDADFAKLGQGVDDGAVLQQPARRPPAARGGHSDAEGRARLLHRRAATSSPTTPTS